MASRINEGGLCRSQGERTRRWSLIAALLVAATLIPSPAAGAQDAPASPPATTSGSGGAVLVVTDAQLRGSGPWTAQFGASPRRELVVTVLNVGSVRSAPVEVDLRSGWGGGSGTETTTIEPLDPGERRSVQLDVELPAFSIGTYAVEGSIVGSDPLISFRAETSHLPWPLVLLPLAVLVQVVLIALRNRVRRRIFGPSGPTPEPGGPEVAAPRAIERDAAGAAVPDGELAEVIAGELASVFDTAMAAQHRALDEAAAVALVVDLSREASGRVADRCALPAPDRAELDHQIAGQMLTAFGLHRSLVGVSE